MRKRTIWHLEEYLRDPNSDFKTKSEFIRDAVRKKLRERSRHT